MSEVKDEIQQQRTELLTYTKWMVLPPRTLMDLSAEHKLIICQITPPTIVKKWPVGFYVPIGYIERCLNFVSDFQWWLKVQREQIVTRQRGNKVIYDARCLADFYIVLDGKKIERSCYGARQMPDNPAVSTFAALEAARSIATKSFADTLGIASDKLSKEFDELRTQREKENIKMKDVVEWFEKTNLSDNPEQWT